jgi:hypothetical protein
MKKTKNFVCLIDEDPNVALAWRQCLGEQIAMEEYQDHRKFFNDLEEQPENFSLSVCFILGRYFKGEGQTFDLVEERFLEMIRSKSSAPIFLNWQGFIKKEEEARFDGRLFHKYGLKWSSLKGRIQKLGKTGINRTPPPQPPPPLPTIEKVEQEPPVEMAPIPQRNPNDRPKRCTDLLFMMADRAEGSHRDKIQELANEDQHSGIALLEAIYDRLMKDKNTSPTCPSRYIHSSPVVAKRILHEALFC